MKVSEMTNEELAARLEVHAVSVMGCVGSSKTGREIAGDIREAAARLRQPTPVDDDLLKMASDIDKLRAKLKVAEDALEKVRKCIDNRFNIDVCILAKNIIADALDAIRESVTNCSRGMNRIANGNLIDAAPELYKWLAFAVEQYKCETRSCNNCPNGKCWIVDATAALARASGESEVRDE